MENKYCKVCFNPIEPSSPLTVFLSPVICDSCLAKRKFHFNKEKIGKLNIFSIYYHDDVLMQWLYQYKTICDYELRSVFLTPFELLFKFLTLNKVVIPLPSTDESIQKRGFNHLIGILESADIRYSDILGKTAGPVQKDLTLEDRKKVKDRIIIKKRIDLSKKDIILFDDVLTTGSTMVGCFEKLQELKPRSIRGFALMRQHYS